MNELESLDSPTAQLDEIKAAISAGDFSSLQGLLLNQTVMLHKLGAALIEKSTEQGTVKLTCAYVDMALRAFSQSQKALIAIKFMKSEG